MHINRLRETFLIRSTIKDEITSGLAKIESSYPYKDYYTITTFKQSETDLIVQVWENYRF